MPDTKISCGEDEIIQLEEIPDNATEVPIEIVDVRTSPEWDSWNPSQLRNAKHPALEVANLVKTNEMYEENENKLTPHVSQEIGGYEIKNVRKSKLGKQTILSQLQQKRVANNSIDEELVKKKIEFIDLQIALLKEEAAKKEEGLAEKHKLEIQILQEELKNATNKVYNN